MVSCDPYAQLVRLPPLEGLVAVIAAHETGSFSAAADLLGITHGAVSRRIHAVEHWLGTPLFTRHARGVQATPAGQRFVANRAKSEDRRFEDYDLVLAAAEAGLGLAMLRAPLAHDRVNSGRLVRVSRAGISNELGNFLVMRSDESRPAVLRVAQRLQSSAAELVRSC